MQTEAIMYIADRSTDVLCCLIVAVFMYQLVKLFVPKIDKDDKL